LEGTLDGSALPEHEATIAKCLFLCRFCEAAEEGEPPTLTGGVAEAPRHEIAGVGAPDVFGHDYGELEADGGHAQGPGLGCAGDDFRLDVNGDE
jgi:hypothetical protein